MISEATVTLCRHADGSNLLRLTNNPASIATPHVARRFKMPSPPPAAATGNLLVNPMQRADTADTLPDVTARVVRRTV